MKLSYIIKNYRKGQLLTIDKLSRKAHLSKGFISRLEKGDFDMKNISLESIIKLANGLGIKVKEILDDLSIIEQEEPLALKVYLRDKYSIKNEDNIKFIENLIKKLN